MKNWIKIALCLTVLFVSNNAFAQQTFGHLNSMELLSSLPEWKSAQKELETFAEKLRQQLESKEKALVEEYNALMQQQNTLAPVVLEEKMQAIQQKQASLEQDSRSAQNDVLKKEEQLTTPIRDRVLTAIEGVAKENGYTYIFDTSAGSLVFAAESEDVFSKVKSKMGF